MLPHTNPLRYTTAPLPIEMEARLAQAQGRAFAPRTGGDLTVTLPNVGGVATFLVPRGFGHPLPARRLGAELRADPGGEACSPARWVPTGGVAAWLRHVPTPRGPIRAVPASLLHEDGGHGPHVYVRPVSLAWSAARLRAPSAGHGAVAVADRRVIAPSPAARAAGVVRGMSLRLAARRCPGLVFVPPAAADLRPEVARRLAGLFGVVQVHGPGFIARLPEAVLAQPAALDVAEHIARLLWQELGVEARITIANTVAGAVALSRWLEPGWVAVAAPGADAELGSRRSGGGRVLTTSRGASWAGPATPDLEAVVTRAGVLAGTLTRAARGATLRLVVRGARGTRRIRVRIPLACTRRGLVRLVEALIRREAAPLGAVDSVRLSVHPTRVAQASRAARSLASALRSAAERAADQRTLDHLLGDVLAAPDPRRRARGNAHPEEDVQLSLLPRR